MSASSHKRPRDQHDAEDEPRSDKVSRSEGSQNASSGAEAPAQHALAGEHSGQGGKMHPSLSIPYFFLNVKLTFSQKQMVLEA